MPTSNLARDDLREANMNTIIVSMVGTHVVSRQSDLSKVDKLYTFVNTDSIVSWSAKPGI